MSKILVTGGAGFIGSNLVDELVRLKHKVAVVDDLSTGKIEYLNPKAKFYQANICDEKKIAEIFRIEKPQYVFHLAAQMDIRKSVDDPIFDSEVNIGGGLNILKNCWKNKVKKIIFPSTAGIYGETKKPVSEEAPKFFEAPYALHKYAFEKHLEIFSKIYKIDFAVLRFANVYGPRQYKGGEGAVVGIFTYNAVRGLPCKIFGDGRQTRDFIFVDDVVKACLKAAFSANTGVYNISTGKIINLFALIKSIEKVNNKKIIYRKLPRRPGEIRNNSLNPKRANRILKWKALVSLEEGIKKTSGWVKSQKG
ncbi:MAG: NAD-dependent epimerase/dehydratase family protein [Patescibacteria group bacterium]|nr:NAD-dependent epimerase/dehydratase family protein [Patescibacteria group bacterium]